MRNYILIYQIRDKDSKNELLVQMKDKYPKNKVIIDNNNQYFLFAARELPGVQDEIHSIMDVLNFTDSDFIALYYTREEEPDEINRLMLFGPSSLVESKNINTANHERILGELLEFDFIRSKK